MSRSMILALASSAALAGTAPASAAAQARRPTSPSMSLAGAPGTAPAALKPAYHVRLTSTWPQETGGQDCRNGGEEDVEGTLSRNADGTFRTAGGSGSCAITLAGSGQVRATGVVLADDQSPSGRSMRLVWSPAPDQRATVTGACADSFKRAVKAMYLSTAHAAEFGLTPAGAGPRTERLENYAWKVELE